MTNYEMIVLDLDGTLTNRDKVITPRTKQALMSAQEQGKIVVLASGRPTAGVEPLAKELELERFGSYILSYNGGMITNCRTGEVVFASQIPLAANERIIGLAEEHRDVYKRQLRALPAIPTAFISMQFPKESLVCGISRHFTASNIY